MKIKRLTLSNFMAFENLQLYWSDNINIICGENSTGKTTLLKVMYSLTKPLNDINKTNLTKEMEEQFFVKKMQGVFRPDDMKLGRLVSRNRGNKRTDFSVDLARNHRISVGFSRGQTNHADISIDRNRFMEKCESIYIPTKEMISTVEHFVTLYDEYHIDFEEMYYDLAKLLDRPLSKGPNTTEQNQVLRNLEEIMSGNIVQKNKKFYFKIKGVQIFVSTHDYFIQQEFNMVASYPKLNPEKLDIRFLSLYRDEKTHDIHYEMTNSASDLEHNAIMQEFDAMYDREQRIIYGEVQ